MVHPRDQMAHHEDHKAHRVGWLRAAVLGANDGIVSTASLITGIAAAQTSKEGVVLAGIAGLVAGAMSMAAGEYVSVCSQADTEKADLEQERQALAQHYDFELLELAQIYQGRGLEPALAKQVAEQLMAHDALGAHARDEIGISPISIARPLQAALYSAATFTLGAGLPLIVAIALPVEAIIVGVTLASVVFLGFLGALAARAGGAAIATGAFRVAGWGALAMAVTVCVGRLFGGLV